MIPLFGDERKRKINLGGFTSASSSTTILSEARARRDERTAQKRKEASAIKLQAWWRGHTATVGVREQLKSQFKKDVGGIVGLRCLVRIGEQDEEALEIWARQMANGNPDTLFELARDARTRESWIVLIRQVSFLLLRSISKSPMSSCAPIHLQILHNLLSVTETSRMLGESGAQVANSIAAYLLIRGFYPLTSQAIRAIPLASRSSPSLPLLSSLATLPLLSFATGSAQYKSALSSLFSTVLTVPLLPNRLPQQALMHLSSHIPFAHLPVLQTSAFSDNDIISPEDRVHLVSNLQVFVPPRYKHLPIDALKAYIMLLTVLLNATPISALNPVSSKSSVAPGNAASHTGPEAWADSEGDDDDEPATRVSVVSAFSLPAVVPVVPRPDPKTLKRLSALRTPEHIASLLSLSIDKLLPSLVPLFVALSAVWPGVLPSILAHPAGGTIVKGIYRGWVRGGGLGREGDPLGRSDAAINSTGSNTSLQSEQNWVMLLALADLYTKALVTMGDDEFFGRTNIFGDSGGSHTLGSSSNSGSGLSIRSGVATAARNPLTLDELTSFSRQLLNIAFALYLRTDGDFMATLVSSGVRYTWEAVREKVTRCLIGIHARDSRQPFVPPDHWLVSSQIDMQSFVEAAISEEGELSSSTPAPRSSRGQSHHTKRQLAYLSPRLGVLNNIPFAIPFSTRVKIFRNFVTNDVISHSSSPDLHAWMRGMGSGRTRVQVRRGNVAQDGFDRLAEADLKAPIEIAFIDQFGGEEAGIDGGGVFKEFFTSLCKEVFDTDRGLWLASKKNELYPNPHAYATEVHSLNWYRFIGRILGKAMYEGILVDVAFAGFFLAKWLGRQSFLDDLASLDPELYNGLIFLKHYTGNFEDLALNFTVAIDEFGVTKSIDLIPNGSNVAVTRQNRLQYIYLVSHYRLTKQIKLQSEAFFDGLSEMIDPKWIRMFNQQEIQILIGGVNSQIDFEDLRKNTNYGGLYDDQEPTIVAFWNVVETFNREQRMALLRFVTSCSRPPLLGFKELVPNFSIRDAGSDQLRLPTSSTCVNLLKLPRYKSEKILRDKLLQAITSNAGFDLS